MKQGHLKAASALIEVLSAVASPCFLDLCVGNVAGPVRPPDRFTVGLKLWSSRQTNESLKRLLLCSKRGSARVRCEDYSWRESRRELPKPLRTAEKSVCFVLVNPCSGRETHTHRIVLCKTTELLNKTSECAIS